MPRTSTSRPRSIRPRRQFHDLWAKYHKASRQAARSALRMLLDPAVALQKTRIFMLIEAPQALRRQNEALPPLYVFNNLREGTVSHFINQSLLRVANDMGAIFDYGQNPEADHKQDLRYAHGVPPVDAMGPVFDKRAVPPTVHQLAPRARAPNTVVAETTRLIDQIRGRHNDDDDDDGDDANHGAGENAQPQQIRYLKPPKSANYVRVPPGKPIPKPRKQTVVKLDELSQLGNFDRARKALQRRISTAAPPETTLAPMQSTRLKHVIVAGEDGVLYYVSERQDTMVASSIHIQGENCVERVTETAARVHQRVERIDVPPSAVVPAHVYTNIQLPPRDNMDDDRETEDESELNSDVNSTTVAPISAPVENEWQGQDVVAERDATGPILNTYSDDIFDDTVLCTLFSEFGGLAASAALMETSSNAP